MPSGGAVAAAAAAASAAPDPAPSPSPPGPAVQQGLLEAHFGEQNRLLQSQIAANSQGSSVPFTVEEQKQLAQQLLQRVENSVKQRALTDVSNTYKQLLAETTRIGDAQLAQQRQFAAEQLKVQRESIAALDRSAAAVETMLNEFRQHNQARSPL
jgi:hypothetical protein